MTMQAEREMPPGREEEDGVHHDRQQAPLADRRQLASTMTVQAVVDFHGRRCRRRKVEQGKMSEQAGWDEEDGVARLEEDDEEEALDWQRRAGVEAKAGVKRRQIEAVGLVEEAEVAGLQRKQRLRACRGGRGRQSKDEAETGGREEEAEADRHAEEAKAGVVQWRQREAGGQASMKTRQRLADVKRM